MDAYSFILSNPTVTILLTSFELKTMPGLELCWRVRANSNHLSSVYLIVMSSYTDVHQLIEALDCGVDDFLRKPFVTGELLARFRAADRIIAAQQQLVKLAATDSPTGSLNRRSFFSGARQAFVRLPIGTPISAIMLDIDHFKKINDSFGHDAGDNVLCQLVERIGSDCPLLARLGGEEFITLLYDTDITKAYALAEKIRKKICDTPFPVGDGFTRVSCSLGIAESKVGGDLTRLLKNADTALYEAKKNGRNQTNFESGMVHAETG